jgi:hypothetical protein
MPRTTRCTTCGVVLNLPENAVGKRLKCPKCGTKFQAGDSPGNMSSIVPGLPMASPDSSQDLQQSRSEDGLPVAAGDLRETFDLPLLREAAPSPSASSKSAADALALFDDRRPAPRRPSAAEARAKARRCPTCGGVVTAGMSLCSTCGLDLETGTRVSLDDDLALPPPPRPSGPPLAISIIGGLCLLGSAVATIVPIANWLVWHKEGWLWFVPLGLFAIFASVQFLRGKSAKLLLVALSLGAAIDVVALIALPIVFANMEAPRTTPIDDPNSEGMVIQSITERLDAQKLGLGIGVLLGYAGLAVSLCSPPIRRFIKS